MSISSFLIKGTLGVTVVGGSGAAGYIYRKEISNFWNSDNKVFLVQANEVSDDVQDINASGNYCALNLEIDDDCEIKSLDWNEQKYIDTLSFLDSSQAAKKLTNNSFYKLVVNRWKIKSLVNNTNTTINVKTGLGKEAKDIAKLKIISTMYTATPSKAIDTWTGLKVLVQANKSVVETTDMELSTEKCKLLINNADQDIKCSVYKFEDYSSNKNSLNFSKIKKLTKFNEIQAGQYYIVDLDLADKAKVTEQNIETISIKKNSSTNVSLTFKSKIITNLKESDTDYANTQAILLDDEFEKDEFNSTYVVVKSHTDAGNDSFSSQNHNYKCKNNSKTYDCLLLQLKDEERTITQITNSVNPVTDSELKNSQNKYFKIYSNNDIIHSTTWNGATTIDVVDKTTDTTVYKKFTPLFLVENGKVSKIKTPLLFSSATELGGEIESVSFADNMTHKCTIGTVSTENDCDIYKFASQPDPKNLMASLNSGTLEKTKTKDDWKVGNSYLIYLKNNSNFELPPATGQTVNVSVKISDNTKKEIAKLTVKNLLWNSATFNGDVSKLLVLSEQ